MRRFLLASILASASLASAAPDVDVPEWVPRKRVVITSTSYTAFEPFAFEPGVSTISEDRTLSLDAVAETMIGNPSISMLAVQTYGDDALEDRDAQELAETRAQLVTMYLVSRGVEPWRLTPEGIAYNVEDAQLQFVIRERTP